MEWRWGITFIILSSLRERLKEATRRGQGRRTTPYVEP